MREMVCRLQLLLVLFRAVILRSESRGTRDHILLSQIRDSQTWRARSPYLYPPGTGWPSYTPGTGSLSVASYDSQGYSGVIRTRLHAGKLLTLEFNSHIFSRHGPRSAEKLTRYYFRDALPLSCLASSLGADLQKTSAFIIPSIVVWRHRALVNWRTIATAVRVTYCDTFSIVKCGYYLATADIYGVTSQEMVHTSQYEYIRYKCIQVFRFEIYFPTMGSNSA
jgi:hypothetical protein